MIGILTMVDHPQDIRAWLEGAKRGHGPVAMTARRRPVPKRHSRSYGEAPVPSGAETLDEPFSAFPSWFMRITCDRCGKDRMVNEAHTAHRDLPIRAILDWMRHDGCGGRAGKAELLTGIEGASSRPVRKIALPAAGR
jgi:hypothetical protein